MKRFIVDLQDSLGHMQGCKAEFSTATEAAEYMDMVDNRGNGSLRAVCWLEEPESFEATTERLLARIMEIAE